MHDGFVEIHPTYAGDVVRVAREDLQRATREFLRRVLDELCTTNPTLATNPAVRRLYPKSLVIDAQ
jgi:hypothetical protein